jgi:hypothetical protein
MREDFICKDCKYYKPVDEVKGNCFEQEVLAKMPTQLCPVQGFELARKIPLQSHMVFETIGDIHTKTVLDTHMKKKKEDWLFK